MKIAIRNRLYILFIPIVVGILQFLWGPVFYLNDDGVIRSILSGAYTGTPDGHVVYMQYPLSGILAWLYKLNGECYWLEFFFVACIVLCCILVAGKIPNLLLGILVPIVIFVPFAVYTNYTLVAAVVAATGIFLMMVNDKHWWSVILVWLAYMIRSQIGLLCLPFMLCAVLWRVLSLEQNERKKESIRYALMSMFMLAGILVCLCVNAVCYGKQEWKEYLAYNDARTELYDYIEFPYTEYSVGNSTQLGVTENEYNILHSYNIMLDAGIGEEKLNHVVDIVSDEWNGNNEKVTFLEIIWDYCRHIIRNDRPYNYMVMILYIVLIVSIVSTRRWKYLLIPIGLGLGRSVIWIYLMGQGRFPERVSLSLYLFEIMLLLGMFLKLPRMNHLKSPLKTILVSGTILLTIILGCYQWKNTTNKIQQREVIQVGWNGLKEYCEKNPETLYWVDVFSVAQYGEKQYDKDAQNIKLLGGWTSNIPLVKDVFADLGVTDAAEALYYCDTVKLIVAKNRDISWLEKYLQDRFPEAKFVNTAEIEWDNGVGFIEYSLE